MILNQLLQRINLREELKNGGERKGGVREVFLKRLKIRPKYFQIFVVHLGAILFSFDCGISGDVSEGVEPMALEVLRLLNEFGGFEVEPILLTEIDEFAVFQTHIAKFMDFGFELFVFLDEHLPVLSLDLDLFFETLVLELQQLVVVLEREKLLALVLDGVLEFVELLVVFAVLDSIFPVHLLFILQLFIQSLYLLLGVLEFLFEVFDLVLLFLGLSVQLLN